MSKTGRFWFRYNGKLYCVEPIDNGQRDGAWGEVIPGAKKLEKVTAKYQGSVKDSESIITEENGFTNIVDLKPGESPLDYLERLGIKDGDED